ncbi:MAG TPA: sulfide/dihydroorotate dehydrogenase-like FAD/NAD-binding protein [Candidatus Limnocylindrales bacterium]|nr:sulfide/dihydroorotate dehydrogenase-like FAD/NAD-binding protein [Candidatus Limnocylindrales bacterium]
MNTVPPDSTMSVEFRSLGRQMHPIVAKSQLSPNVWRLVVEAPRIAQIREPGQFVIVRRGPGAERIPLTIADTDPEAGTISLVIQAIGKSTTDLVELEPGDAITDVAGPLGRATELIGRTHAVCVGGGVGTAVVYPIAQELHRRGIRVTSITGGRAREWVMLEKELADVGEVLVCTDDGSYGRHGFVTDALRDVLAAGDVDAVYAVGPVPMMRAVAEMTRPLGVPTVASLNAIMVDGTGMCGGCRVSIGGETRYACVDGPEFDAHLVDFGMLADRLATYRSFETEAMERRGPCRIGLRKPADADAPAPASTKAVAS